MTTHYHQWRDVPAAVPALYQLATGTVPSASLRGFGFRERIAGARGVPIVFEWPEGGENDLDAFLSALDCRHEPQKYGLL